MPENNFDSNEKFLLKLSSFSLLELTVTLLKEGFFTDIYLEISQTIRKSFLRNHSQCQVVVNFEHISHLALAFLLPTLNM